MPEMNIQETKDLLSRIFADVVKNDNMQPPIALHSKPGIGKSAIVQDVAKEANENHTNVSIGFRDLRLSAMESSDVQGIPHVDPSSGDMRFSTPEWFPNGDKEPYGILFLDELPNADIDVQKAGYRIVHDRTIQNGKKLPDGWLVVMAGNRKEDKTGVNRLLPALANRFGAHIDVMPDSKAFIQYAFSKGMHPAVTSFLMERPDFVHKFDPKSDDHAFPSPRSWEFVSNYLNLFKLNPRTQHVENIGNELRTLINGAVGEAAAYNFVGHLKYYQRLPNLDEIARGENTTYKDKLQGEMSDVGVQYALTSSLIQKISEYRDNNDALENLKGVVEMMEGENQVMLFRGISGFSRDMARNLLFYSPLHEVYQQVAPYLKKL